MGIPQFLARSFQALETLKMKLLFAVTLLAMLSLATSIQCYGGKIDYSYGNHDIYRTSCESSTCIRLLYKEGEELGCGTCEKANPEAYCEACYYDYCNYNGASGAVHLSKSALFAVAAACLLVKLA